MKAVLALGLLVLAGCVVPVPSEPAPPRLSAPDAVLFLHLNDSSSFVFNLTEPQGTSLPQLEGACVPGTDAVYRGLLGHTSGNATLASPLTYPAELKDRAKLVWYLQTETPNQVPLVAPVEVEATLAFLRASESRIERVVVASGKQVQTLSPVEPTHDVVDGRHTYRFEIPLQVSKPTIPAQASLSLEVAIRFQDLPCNHLGLALPPVLHPYSDARHRPSLHLAVANPLTLAMYYHLTKSDLILDAKTQQVWGCQGTTRTESHLTIRGPRSSYPRDVFQNVTRLASMCSDLNWTTPWTYRSYSASGSDGYALDVPPDGVYDVTGRIVVQPGNVTVDWSAVLTLEEGYFTRVNHFELHHPSPAPGILVFVFLLAVARWRKP